MWSKSPGLLPVSGRLGLGLALLVALCLAVAGTSLHAHAHAAANATLTVTDCSGETGPGRIGTIISGASAGDTIGFSCGGTIPITSTLLIGKNLTLDGSRQVVTLDGGNRVQVLSVDTGVIFTLNALTIADGFDHSFPGGAGLFNNGGTVSISNSTFANNKYGGALLNYQQGTVSISNSTFVNNLSGSNGGGALYNYLLGTVSISNSTFANNSSRKYGGALYNSVGTVSISNSTFAHNSAYDGGGALYNLFGTTNISNSTYVNNSTSLDGAVVNSFGTVSIGGSIVANNTGGNCSGGVGTQGYNLESSSDCGFTGNGDLQNTSPGLDPKGLQFNGGPTRTIALEPDSAAVDHIPVGSSCPATDQRGASRPQGPTCDIGAFEMTSADGLKVTVNVVNSFSLKAILQKTLDGELDIAIGAAKAKKPGIAIIALDAFISDVQVLSGNALTQAQATQLVNEATVIKTRLASK